MLAAFAFITTGVVVACFAATMRGLRIAQKTIPNYWLAYALLSLAFITYGVSALINNQYGLEFAVLAGNLCIFLGSGLLLIRLQEKREDWMSFALLAAIALVIFRAAWFYPLPELKEGILFFNTQLPVGLLIGGLFVAIWLPANIKLSHAIAKSIRLPEAHLIYAGLFTLATVSAVFFLASRSRFSVIISFATIAASFLALLFLNTLVAKMEVHRGGK